MVYFQLIPGTPKKLFRAEVLPPLKGMVVGILDMLRGTVLYLKILAFGQ